MSAWQRSFYTRREMFSSNCMWFHAPFFSPWSNGPPLGMICLSFLGRRVLSGEIFDTYDWEGATGTQWVEAREAAKRPQSTSATKNDLPRDVTIVAPPSRFAFCGFSYLWSTAWKQRILFLMYCQNVNSILTLRHSAYIVGLASLHHAGIVSSHIMTRSRVQYHEIF